MLGIVVVILILDETYDFVLVVLSSYLVVGCILSMIELFFICIEDKRAWERDESLFLFFFQWDSGHWE